MAYNRLACGCSGYSCILLPIPGLAMVALILSKVTGERIRKNLVDNRTGYAAAGRCLLFVLTGAFVFLAYVFFTTLGTWTNWPPTTDYYDRLALAFAAGHLHVKEAPDPALVALQNPYDPDARKGIPGLEIEAAGTIWDMSLYGGRIYLYWGPAPALVLLGLRAALPGVVGDQYVTFAGLVGTFLFGALILLRLRRRFFADLPLWMTIAGLLVLAFANPGPWLLFSPRIYESAIATGQCFLMAGTYLAFTALDKQSPFRWRLALAAVLWACAVGSRATLAIAVAYLSVMVVGWLAWTSRREGQTRSGLLSAAAFGLPLVVAAGMLAWYNYARFGSIFEFGFRYAITMLDQNRYRAVLFSSSYLGPNAYMYLLNPPSLSGLFPFVKPVWNEEYVMAFNSRFHAIYNSERIIGLIYVAPFLLFGLVPLAAAFTGMPRLVRTWAVSDSRDEAGANGRIFDWFTLTLCGLGLLQLLVVFLVFYATMRYFMDAIPTLVILSMLGFWHLYRRLPQNGLLRGGFILGASGLALFTILMGVLIGFSSDVPRLKAVNPALLVHLKLFFIALARRLGW